MYDIIGYISICDDATLCYVRGSLSENRTEKKRTNPVHNFKLNQVIIGLLNGDLCITKLKQAAPHNLVFYIEISYLKVFPTSECQVLTNCHIAN